MTYKDSNRERKGRVEGERNRGVGVRVREASESERSATDTSQARVLLPHSNRLWLNNGENLLCACTFKIYSPA